MLYYKNSMFMMTATYYKDNKSMMTSLIIMKIKFVCFKENKVDKSFVRLYARLYARLHIRLCTKSHDYMSCDHSVTITFFFDMSFDIQVIVKKLFATR